MYDDNDCPMLYSYVVLQYYVAVWNVGRRKQKFVCGLLLLLFDDDCNSSRCHDVVIGEGTSSKIMSCWIKYSIASIEGGGVATPPQTSPSLDSMDCSFDVMCNLKFITSVRHPTITTVLLAA